MSTVPYYQGRPARLWTAVMSRSARTAAATPAAPASPVSPRPTAQRKKPEEASLPFIPVANTSAWEVWASNWFTRTASPNLTQRR
jgi:hypothetical protein